LDKKGREAVTEVVEAESLTRFKAAANLINGGGANLSAAIILPFIFVEGKIQSSGLA
jgi:hypothetical protein